jgi:pimeloyl-ACP methyl ester carboxylesterase
MRSTTGEQLLEVNGVELCTQAFGNPSDPAVLLVGTSMLAWDAEVCRLLADGGRYVLRYDLRDTGRSTTIDPEDPAYTLRDLVDDAVGVLDALGVEHAHVMGLGPGGWIAQLLALDHPDRLRTLVIIGSRPVAPGPVDDDLPDHDPALMELMVSAPEPDWDDREAALDALVALERASGPFDEAAFRRAHAEIYDRTRAAAPEDADLPPRFRANHTAVVFARLESGDRWRERLGEIRVPTLVVHGEDDRFFPIGNGRALAAEIPGASLQVLAGVGRELPPGTFTELVPVLLRHTARR